ncbi:MAG: metalloregulator ArsR/SmtB family transcription factor [Actinophytocola sp.]|uniref:ArsR/SmtB family transcription factor n=1 Tax=Actinophytocola sp. TaxID=1872138 RepID=UPI0013243862|nr:metalloregulator ArsR/SmtB family transcription factor [Actinophytocola sp.]MPZ83326.1 metalloregulator ArsR/SmtB family transcription factor [Actinophytocola sp.]
MGTQLDDVLAALADPARRRVVDVLRVGPRRAGELASSVDMSGPAMSRHLRVLRATGLVEAAALDGDARVRVYRLRAEPFTALRAWLDQVEAFWGDQLGAFAAHVDKEGDER